MARAIETLCGDTKKLSLPAALPSRSKANAALSRASARMSSSGAPDVRRGLSERTISPGGGGKVPASDVPVSAVPAAQADIAVRAAAAMKRDSARGSEGPPNETGVD